MKADLIRAKRDPSSGRVGTLNTRPAAANPLRGYPLIAWLGVLLAVGLGAVIVWQLRHRAVGVVSSGNPTTVSVLPFQNAGSDKDTDFLTLGLARRNYNHVELLARFVRPPFRHHQQICR